MGLQPSIPLLPFPPLFPPLPPFLQLLQLSQLSQLLQPSGHPEKEVTLQSFWERKLSSMIYNNK